MKKLAAAFLPLALALAAPAHAQQGGKPVTVDHSRQYFACMKMAGSHPADAVISANAWREKGGGVPADHCVGVALFNLRRYAEAGQVLEQLAANSTLDRPGLRAELYSQAGQAWEAANQPKRALAAQNAGLKLSPNNIELLLDRAILLASEGSLADAVLDLDQVLKLNPKRHDALSLRASAQRVLGQPAKARDDVEAALKLKPDYPEALLERGIQRALAKDNDGARADFVRVQKIAGVNSPLSREAGVQLGKLDGGR